MDKSPISFIGLLAKRLPCAYSIAGYIKTKSIIKRTAALQKTAEAHKLYYL